MLDKWKARRLEKRREQFLKDLEWFIEQNIPTLDETELEETSSFEGNFDDMYFFGLEEEKSTLRETEHGVEILSKEEIDLFSQKTKEIATGLSVHAPGTKRKTLICGVPDAWGTFETATVIHSGMGEIKVFLRNVTDHHITIHKGEPIALITPFESGYQKFLVIRKEH